MSDLSAMTKAGFVATPAEWNRLVSAAESLAQRALQMERERDAAWKELRAIRDIVSADENEATEDEVSRVVYQRDQARGLLALARAEVERLRSALERGRMAWANFKVVMAFDVSDFSEADSYYYEELDAALRGKPAPAVCQKCNGTGRIYYPEHGRALLCDACKPATAKE